MPRRNAAYIKNENEGGARISTEQCSSFSPQRGRWALQTEGPRRGASVQRAQSARQGGAEQRESSARYQLIISLDVGVNAAQSARASKGKAPRVINLSYCWMRVSTRQKANAKVVNFACSVYGHAKRNPSTLSLCNLEDPCLGHFEGGKDGLDLELRVCVRFSRVRVC